MPQLCGGDYVWSVVTDHAARRTDLWHDEEHEEAARAILKRLKKAAPARMSRFSVGSRFSTDMSDCQYVDAFNAIQAHLLSGECYQVNLARHYATSLRGDRRDASWAAYRRLASLQPVPHGAYISTPYGDVVSLSPERFVLSVGSHIVTSPSREPHRGTVIPTAMPPRASSSGAAKRSRRKPDDRRPVAQRPGPHLPAGNHSRRRSLPSRIVRERSSPRELHPWRDRFRRRRLERAESHVPGRFDYRCTEDSRDGNHQRAGAGREVGLLRQHRLH